MSKLPIPFFSQLDERVPEELRKSVCAIACVKMILDYKNGEIDFSTILKEAEWIGEKDKAGWTHEVLVRVLRNHNILSYRQEFIAHNIDLDLQIAQSANHSEEFIQKGIEKIKKSIDANNPVMVSVTGGFSKNNGDHLVLVIGYEDNSLIIHDPILHSDENPKIIDIEYFLKFWKKLAIFVE